MANGKQLLVLLLAAALTSGCLRSSTAHPKANALYATPEHTTVKLEKPCRLDSTGKRTAEPCVFRLIIDTVTVLSPTTEGK
jgi:hypothetical protein